MMSRVKEKERGDGERYLNGEITTINVIAQEKITGIGWVASHLKEFHQIVELSMNIPAY